MPGVRPSANPLSTRTEDGIGYPEPAGYEDEPSHHRQKPKEQFNGREGAMEFPGMSFSAERDNTIRAML
jgi:hypothetical protein